MRKNFLDYQQILNAGGKDRDHLFWHYPHGGGNSMNSAIRSGDFKLYKRYDTNSYELYRLYENGKREDLEEAHDLANNPEFAAVIERLGKVLEAELAANNAEGPYLNPNYIEKKTPSASLGKTSYESAKRQANLTINPSGPALKEAYVIYRATKVEGKRPPGDIPSSVSISGMKAAATISADGSSVSATIPKDVNAFCFLLIYTNNYLQYSKVVSAK